MKLSRNFVNDYTNLTNTDMNALAESMVRIGNEYESIKKLVDTDTLIIGEVKECSRHPESDHLNVCKVDIKSEILNIICGAPNVKKGIKVIVATDGTKLPGGTIKKTTILGYESNGMICSLSELGIENKFLKKEDVDGIHVLNTEAPVGEDAIKYLEMDDVIIDFELTSNRADELSMLGLAYEVSALTKEKVILPNINYKELDEDINSSLSLKIETDNVYTFLAKKVNNIEIKESPTFIKNRLIACGIRPINNVVDISNYVMLETGQPLHYYDADKLGAVIGARMAKDGESVLTLDSIKRILTKDDIVITDGEKAIGLAGVMGGYDTEITKDTKNIVIESAIFNPLNIRQTSKKLLRSEASIRFEKILDVNRTYFAIERSCHLLEKYAGGFVEKGILEHNNISREDKVIEITLDKINSVLGYEFKCDDIIEVFNKLDFVSECKKNKFVVTIPTRRVDISIEEDLIEEVGRIYGVDNIKGTLPVFESSAANYNKTNRIIRDKMVSLGLNEVITYSLINVKDVFKFTNDEFGLIKVLSPMTEERVVLRHSLITSILGVYDYNKSRNIKDLSIFEIGTSFSLIEGEYIEENKLSCLLAGKYISGINSEEYDFYTVKGIIEELLDYLGLKNRYSFVSGNLPEEMHPSKSVYINVNGKIIGLFGAVHPNIYKEDVYVAEINLSSLLEIKTGKLKYKEFSKYPGISKDLAFIISKNINSEDVVSTIKQTGGKLLKSVDVFDYYEGEKIDNNKKSIAYNLYFESFDKTLTDEEINQVFDKIIENVAKKHNAILRDK
ncbi:MAG: phenylalanine--tRNA ligase subunit beta [Tenericutes bacterium]|nr:phenylalanine--tRNA ligase subunit beta [Mycoplasmatota bacterium]